ncbi:hypothetical protein [Deinococcus ruber]|uniref:Uncharacterized protein n=1 Tax=Deinococcus ruber TaxID=1848197 RepID=A0A918C2G9_9DEIO|nr:hypothetical protein [Deinococcus ruber]GGR02218.1 hypothetical protein GCM10008957_13940 [Deinococcus ruber]
MNSPLRPFRLLLLLGVLCTSPVQALELVVWDPQLQTKLGYGEVVGTRLNLQLVTDYSGPVVALFSRDSSEKNSYPGLLSRYGGSLRGGTLTLDTDDSGPLPLSKLLSTYKLSVTPLNTTKTFSLPGLKSTPPNK